VLAAGACRSRAQIRAPGAPPAHPVADQPSPPRARGAGDPSRSPAGLHRLRLAGELAEIRAAELRFTERETRELLDASGIALSDAATALLHRRTEGWAAGLRLAVISLAGHPDPERFVAEFSGSDRTVAEYLLAEMLDRQSDDVQQLLLRTSLLDRVNGELADLLTGRPARRGSCWGSRTRTRSWSGSTPSAGGFATTTCSGISCGWSNAGRGRGGAGAAPAGRWMAHPPWPDIAHDSAVGQSRPHDPAERRVVARATPDDQADLPMTGPANAHDAGRARHLLDVAGVRGDEPARHLVLEVSRVVEDAGHLLLPQRIDPVARRLRAQPRRRASGRPIRKSTRPYGIGSLCTGPTGASCRRPSSHCPTKGCVGY
jgi:hypothetical protein